MSKSVSSEADIVLNEQRSVDARRSNYVITQNSVINGTIMGLMMLTYSLSPWSFSAKGSLKTEDMVERVDE